MTSARGTGSIIAIVGALFLGVIAALLAAYCVALLYAAATFKGDSLPGPVVLSMVAIPVGLGALLLAGLARLLWRRARRVP